MPVSFFMDVHVDLQITTQLRKRGVDVITAQEDGSNQLVDDDLLARATSLGRVMFTQDLRFWALATDWIRQGKAFAGLAFGHQSGGIGPFVMDLELIAKATEPGEWLNKVEYLPFKKAFP